MFVLLASTIPRSFYLSEYENLTAVLVETKLQENYFFWGMTPAAKTVQLLMPAGDVNIKRYETLAQEAETKK